jgi:hypothetical protein
MRTIDVVLLGALAAWIAACGSMSQPLPTAPSPTVSAPTTPPAPAPSPSVPGSVVVNGTWTGRGADSFSPELVTWVIEQSGSALSGTAEINAVDPADGTCGSCHKVKRGTLTGTLSGTTVSISMKFPAGGDVPTPICVADFNATGTVVDRRITATYTGTDTCEGVYSNGVMDLTRQ